MIPIRFHQSHAKVLLTESAYDLRQILDAQGREASKAMNAGSLLDYLVFDMSERYEVVDARYKTGPRAGQPAEDWQCYEARQQAREIQARGVLPVLESEIQDLLPVAEACAKKLDELEALFAPAPVEMRRQPQIEWISTEGVACAGRPDVVLLVHLLDCVQVWVIDLKRTAINRRRLGRQVAEMCWDVQAAAYREAALQLAYDEAEDPDGTNIVYGGHTILAVDPGSRPRARAYPLSEAYLEGGRKRWVKAQKMWRECWASGEWPDYPEDPIEPGVYYTRTEIETYDFEDAPTEEP